MIAFVDLASSAKFAKTGNPGSKFHQLSKEYVTVLTVTFAYDPKLINCEGIITLYSFSKKLKG